MTTWDLPTVGLLKSKHIPTIKLSYDLRAGSFKVKPREIPNRKILVEDGDKGGWKYIVGQVLEITLPGNNKFSVDSPYLKALAVASYVKRGGNWATAGDFKSVDLLKTLELITSVPLVNPDTREALDDKLYITLCTMISQIQSAYEVDESTRKSAQELYVNLLSDTTTSIWRDRGYYDREIKALLFAGKLLTTDPEVYKTYLSDFDVNAEIQRATNVQSSTCLMFGLSSWNSAREATFAGYRDSVKPKVNQATACYYANLKVKTGKEVDPKHKRFGEGRNGRDLYEYYVNHLRRATEGQSALSLFV